MCKKKPLAKLNKLKLFLWIFLFITRKLDAHSHMNIVLHLFINWKNFFSISCEICFHFLELKESFCMQESFHNVNNFNACMDFVAKKISFDEYRSRGWNTL